MILVHALVATLRAALLLALVTAPLRADPAIYYAPGENLEHIDVALIGTAQREIDFAAYVLTDWPVIQALTRAAARGVKVRIYLDEGQYAGREPAKVFNDLAATPGVEIRIKRKGSALMHLKSYQIDGRLLRTGAANFSASGLKRQDNDLIVIESPSPPRALNAILRRGLPGLVEIALSGATVATQATFVTKSAARLTSRLLISLVPVAGVEPATY
jgi:phosphatidylserine/phosphatidylglycerophosphate/cardiolipin synthase-like enzyme